MRPCAGRLDGSTGPWCGNGSVLPLALPSPCSRPASGPLLPPDLPGPRLCILHPAMCL